jgi:hypothetical protein
MSDDPASVAGAIVKAGPDSFLEPFKEQVSNLLSPSTEHMGKYFADKLKKKFAIADRANKKLTDRGVTQSRHVPDKLLSPILEHGSLEDDETMTDRWATLLASAADPNFRQSIPPSFPEILRQLSPEETKILEKLYGLFVQGRQEEANYPAVAVPVSENFKIYNGNDFAVSINNLERLGLLKAELGVTATKTTYPRVLHFTKLGFAFVCACRPPGEAEPLMNAYAPGKSDKAPPQVTLERFQRACGRRNSHFWPFFSSFRRQIRLHFYLNCSSSTVDFTNKTPPFCPLFCRVTLSRFSILLNKSAIFDFGWELRQQRHQFPPPLIFPHERLPERRRNRHLHHRRVRTAHDP